MKKLIIIGVYSGKEIESLEVKNYNEAENYIFGKYNACWNIENINENEIIAEVYR